LDEIEQEQVTRQLTTDQNHDDSSPSPNVIITASPDMGRSGSTWGFNAVRLLYRQAQSSLPCDSYWIRQLSVSKLQHRLRHRRGHVLIKTHEYSDYLSDNVFAQQIRPLLTHVIVSVRQGFPSDEAWLKEATFVVPYEAVVAENPEQDVHFGALHVLRKLANHLDINVSDEELRIVDYQLMTLPIPGNQATKLWSFHARRGGRSVPKCSPLPIHAASTGKKIEIVSRHVFITRHGARLDNGPDRKKNWLSLVGHGRRQDAPLSTHGQQAASELAFALSKLPEAQQIHCIVSSPFWRCMETAQIVADAINCRILVEPGLCEVGSQPSHFASDAELQAHFGLHIDFSYVPVMSRDAMPRHEYGDGAAADRTARVTRVVLDRLLGNLLLVGHGASCLGMVQALGGGDSYVGYCSMSHFCSDGHSIDGTPSWKRAGPLNDVSHLSDPQTSLGSAW
jgi:transcription factor C subunit 7